jgi:hypothetical protein
MVCRVDYPLKVAVVHDHAWSHILQGCSPETLDRLGTSELVKSSEEVSVPLFPDVFGVDAGARLLCFGSRIWINRSDVHEVVGDAELAADERDSG